MPFVILLDFIRIFSIALTTFKIVFLSDYCEPSVSLAQPLIARCSREWQGVHTFDCVQKMPVLLIVVKISCPPRGALLDRDHEGGTVTF